MFISKNLVRLLQFSRVLDSFCAFLEFIVVPAESEFFCLIYWISWDAGKIKF